MGLEGAVSSQAPLKFDPTPDVEWWDSELLTVAPGTNTRSYDSSRINEALITTKIHHPVPVASLCERPPAPPQALKLTKDERKKIRRLRKAEEHKVLTDKIRFGLTAAPEPRLTLRNIARILEHDAIANPSALDAKARKQMAERKATHETDNEARRLTPAQKTAKRRRKLDAEAQVEIQVALFKAGDLTDGRVRFKIDVTAQQFNLTGCAILFDVGGINLVVVEGGPRAIRKFCGLMLRRIKWAKIGASDEDKEAADDEPDDGGSDEEAVVGQSSREKHCVLVWKGAVPRRAFKNFRFESCISELLARKVLESRHVPHYWDLVRNYRDPV